MTECWRKKEEINGNKLTVEVLIRQTARWGYVNRICQNGKKRQRKRKEGNNRLNYI